MIMKRHFHVRCIVSLITLAADTKLLSLPLQAWFLLRFLKENNAKHCLFILICRSIH